MALSEGSIRIIVFLTIFGVMALSEAFYSRRLLSVSKLKRWTNNLALVLLNTILLRLIFPLLAFDVALLAKQHSWGLLNAFSLPGWAAVIAGIIMLDLVIYLQHVMFHTVPAFWKLHMMHHADLDIDVTTGLRFHPLEILLSMIIKMAAVAAAGIPAVSVLVLEMLLNATAMFNHSNVFLPSSLDKMLRLLVVTPDMHRVHHSVVIRETNSNFGFNFPWWDRLLGTYRAQPAAGHQGMTIGLSQFRDVKLQNILRMILLPFLGDPGHYAIDKRGREPEQKRH